ncbi:hypothetical protein VTI74DRAFT_9659 [Chaetomium olivicolor]
MPTSTGLARVWTVLGDIPGGKPVSKTFLSRPRRQFTLSSNQSRAVETELRSLFCEPVTPGLVPVSSHRVRDTRIERPSSPPRNSPVWPPACTLGPGYRDRDTPPPRSRLPRLSPTRLEHPAVPGRPIVDLLATCSHRGKKSSAVVIRVVSYLIP